MEIVITSKAKNDLYGFFFKSKGNTSNNVLKYIGEVVEYIEIIKQSPHIGKAIYTNKHGVFRQLIYIKYKILYIIINNKIIILRIVHSARKFNLKRNLNLKNFPDV